MFTQTTYCGSLLHMAWGVLTIILDDLSLENLKYFAGEAGFAQLFIVFQMGSPRSNWELLHVVPRCQLFTAPGTG